MAAAEPLAGSTDAAARLAELRAAALADEDGAALEPAGKAEASAGRDRTPIARSLALSEATNASTRDGLPVPPTSFSGATTSSAPVTGSVSRLASWVSP